MLFNSYEFILAFLPLTFALYFLINRGGYREGAKYFLVGASLLFYAWWNPAYLPLLLGSILFNYSIGRRLASRMPGHAARRVLLLLGISGNLALLAYFKYADFLIANVNVLANVDIPALRLLLPLAISFFSFQQIAYLVDSYRRETREHNLLHYALFVSFFPQLIAGPIVHHKEMMPQFDNPRNCRPKTDSIAKAVFIFSIGLFKKLIVADTLAVWATNGFDIAASLTFIEAWSVSLCYTLQLYFDFSGYTDMAIGAALLFNIRLPINFDSPYKARSIREFWRRWHITLSRFLRDYVYIPLGGNRGVEVKVYTNLMLTFLIGGLWHGAGWTFVVWGALHGSAMVVHRCWQRLNLRLPGWLAWLMTFLFVHVSWVFFRAASFDDALKVLRGMLGMDGIVLKPAWADQLGFLSEYGVRFAAVFGNVSGIYTGWESEYMMFVLLSLLLALRFRNSNELTASLQFGLPSAVLTALLAVLAFMSMSRISEFLYFNF